MPLPLAVLGLTAILLLLLAAWHVSGTLRARTVDQPSSASEQEARDLCERHLTRYRQGDAPEERDPFHATLLSAYPSMARDVAAEEERLHPDQSFRSPFRDLPPDEFLAVCFLDADAFGLRPDDARRIPAQATQRLEIVLRSDDTPYTLRSGSRSEVKPAPPGQSS